MTPLINRNEMLKIAAERFAITHPTFRALAELPIVMTREEAQEVRDNYNKLMHKYLDLREKLEGLLEKERDKK